MLLFTWQALCISQTRIHTTPDDVSSSIHQSLSVGHPPQGRDPRGEEGTQGRGLHSFTYQLNFERILWDRAAFKGCLGGV